MPDPAPDSIQPVGRLKDVHAFRERLSALNLSLPCDDHFLSASAGSPLAAPLHLPDFHIGNRWAIHPMEGWDGSPQGLPSEHTTRRWQRFGESGAKLIWGGEAFAVTRDGRANPNQLCMSDANDSVAVRQACEKAMAGLLETLRETHRERFGPNATDDLLVGLQLTHSGRFSKPNRNDKPEPRIACHHPLLDQRVGIAADDDTTVLSDDEVRAIIDAYVQAAQMAQRVGFGFVDIKHCHGYLGHEFLSAYRRPGNYGGSFEGRTRFLREICEGIRTQCPDLMLGVRLSVFDQPPFHPDQSKSSTGKLGPGIADEYDASAQGPYPGFGCDASNPLRIDLDEPIRLLKMMRDELGIVMVNLSAGSPYYNPHIQRPAIYPPSDGYQPPEDPLVGCVRQIDIVRQLKQAVPDLAMVGTAYSYFQEYLPHVAQAVIREGWVDSVGLGRMVLSYPDLPADCLLHGELRKPKLLCRTFSDCTTAPRNGIISGCYPLDDHYKQIPQANELRTAKQALRERLRVIDA